MHSGYGGMVRPLGARDMATMVVGRWTPAQGYGGGMGMGHPAHGVAGAGAGAGPSSVPRYGGRLQLFCPPYPIRRWIRRRRRRL